MNNKNKPQRGFTLIEIMVVISILGIITSIALPSYLDHIKRAKRAEAKTELLKYAQLQESFFVQNLSYAKNLKQLGFASINMPSAKDLYQIQITQVSPKGCDVSKTPVVSCLSYHMTATPKKDNGQDHDEECIAFRIDNVSRQWAKASLHGTGAKTFPMKPSKQTPAQKAKAKQCWDK